MDNFKKGGIKFNSNLTATNRLFAKNPLLKKRRKKATGIYDPNAKYRFDNGGSITPEQWQKEIRSIEQQIGSPDKWSLEDYNLLQNKLNEYKNWRENTPEGQAVRDSHNVEGEYNIPLPIHLQDYTNAMMKSKLAYANEFGNPAAKRMIVAPDQPYDFGNGMTGTHYMASMDDYAVPQIQDVNGQLMLGDYGPQSTEAIKFDRPADAEYFAAHYKDVSPAFLNKKQKGGPGDEGDEDAEGTSQDNFLRNWFINRQMPTPEGQKLLEKVRPEAIERASQRVPYVMTDTLPDNVAGYYDTEDKNIYLNQTYPPDQLNSTKYHERVHFVQDGDNFYKFLTNPQQNLVDQNIKKPKEISTGNPEWDKNLRENYDDIVPQEEIHARIMTLRRLAGFKPNEVITEEMLNNYFNAVKESGKALDPDIEDLKGVTKGNSNIVNLLNDMVSVPQKQDNIQYAKTGGYIELDLTPEEIDTYKKGGFIVEDISIPSLNQMEEGGRPCPPGHYRINGVCVLMKDVVDRKLKPYVTNNPNDPRIKAFGDSLHLYNQTLANNKNLHSKGMISQLTPVPTNEFQKKIYKKSKIKPIGFIKGYRTSKTPVGMNSTEFPLYPMPRQEVIYKPKTKQSKKLVTKKVEEKPIVKEEVIAEEPITMMPIRPVTKVDIPLQKFIGSVPETKEEETFPDTEVSEEVSYGEGAPDGPNVDWVGRTERYIDWDGNSIGFNGIRFRKPGHGGDLIKKGRRHYLHYPSIESRYQAELVPEEEYAKGGEYNIGDEVELTEAEVKRLRSLGYIIEEV